MGVRAQENSNVPLPTVLTNILCVMVKFTVLMVVTNLHSAVVSTVNTLSLVIGTVNAVLNY